VAEDQVPEAVQMVDVVGRSGRGAGVFGGMDGEVLGQDVQKRVPVKTPGAVEENESGAGALREHAHADAVLPDGQRAGLGAVETVHRAATTAGSGARSRSFSGHQWLTQPSSSQKPRSEGRTSRAKRSMFCSVSSWGMEPICRSTIR